jgi:hypothetical protein
MKSPTGLGRGPRIVIALVCGLLVIGAAIAAHGWYHEQYSWPRKIQMEVLGEVIVDHDSLLSFEGSAHWGQGMFRWTYAVPRGTPGALQRYCPRQTLLHCEFVKHGKPEEEVTTSVSFKEGMVTIEEWWM